MILLLDTSTPICKTYWITDDSRTEETWQADRELADNLIGYLRNKLHERDLTWNDISGIGLYRGPGSFTGLRIGHTVMNTIADDSSIPIVGTTGENWVDMAVQRLVRGESDGLALPLYGREANITTPRK